MTLEQCPQNDRANRIQWPRLDWVETDSVGSKIGSADPAAHNFSVLLLLGFFDTETVLACGCRTYVKGNGSDVKRGG